MGSLIRFLWACLLFPFHGLAFCFDGRAEKQSSPIGQLHLFTAFSNPVSPHYIQLGPIYYGVDFKNNFNQKMSLMKVTLQILQSSMKNNSGNLG